MDRRDETVRKAKLFPKMAVASNVSGWFIFSAISARLAVLRIAEAVGRWRSTLFGAKGWLRAVGYNLLFRFDHSTFSKNRARLMQHDVAKLFFGQVVAQAQQARMMSSEHFSVDGTLIDVLGVARALVENDTEAESLMYHLRSAGYSAVASVEHETQHRPSPPPSINPGTT